MLANMPKQSKTSKPPMEILRSPECRTITVNGVFGGLNPIEGVMLLYTDYPVPTNPQKGEVKIVREIQTVIKLSPVAWKVIANWMASHVQKVEKETGQSLPEKGPAPTDTYIG